MDGTKNRILLLQQLAVRLISRRKSLQLAVLPVALAISPLKLPQLAAQPINRKRSLLPAVLLAALEANNYSVFYPKAVPGEYTFAGNI